MELLLMSATAYVLQHATDSARLNLGC